MSGASFIETPGWREKLLGGQAASDFLGEVGQAYAAAVIAEAPVHTGGYQKGLRSRLFMRLQRSATGEAEAIVATDHSLWHIIEYGSAHNQPYAVFRRAAQRIGLAFADSRRGG